MPEELDLRELAASIVVSYLSNNPVPVGELAKLVSTVHAALSMSVGEPSSMVEPLDKPTPAQIRRSITPDAIFSFVDGKAYKTLKRHLSAHDLTPDSYRARFGLPKTYPMAAESTRALRRATALSSGLGRKPVAKIDTSPKVAPQKRSPKAIPPSEETLK
jgi:predicted transcriptional regulator